MSNESFAQSVGYSLFCVLDPLSPVSFMSLLSPDDVEICVTNIKSRCYSKKPFSLDVAQIVQRELTGPCNLLSLHPFHQNEYCPGFAKTSSTLTKNAMQQFSPLHQGLHFSINFQFCTPHGRGYLTYVEHSLCTFMLPINPCNSPPGKTSLSIFYR